MTGNDELPNYMLKNRPMTQFVLEGRYNALKVMQEISYIINKINLTLGLIFLQTLMSLQERHYISLNLKISACFVNIWIINCILLNLTQGHLYDRFIQTKHFAFAKEIISNDCIINCCNIIKTKPTLCLKRLILIIRWPSIWKSLVSSVSSKTMGSLLQPLIYPLSKTFFFCLSFR